MSVRLEVSISEHAVYLLIGVIVVFILFSAVSAYNPGFSGGVPSTVGHSADEIMINTIVGEKSLQEFINDLDYSIEILDGAENTYASGTAACAAIGKRCIAVMSNNFPYDVPYDSSPSHYNHVCDEWYGGPNANPPAGITQGSDVHTCGAPVGFVNPTYLHVGVLRCAGYFNAICQT